MSPFFARRSRTSHHTAPAAKSGEAFEPTPFGLAHCFPALLPTISLCRLTPPLLERQNRRLSTEVNMLAYCFVFVAIAARFAIAAPFLSQSGSFNFTPVAAALLFFGAHMSRRQAWIPVTLFIASDILLSRLVYGYPLSASDLVTWAWYAAIVLLGSLLASSATPWRIAGASLTASLSFFAVSNLAVWAVWSMYPKTLAGLTECYAMAIPFFRNTVASDLLFAGAFFGMAALLPQFSRKAQSPIA